MSSFEKGEQVFQEFTSGSKHHLASDIQNLAPDIHKYIIEFVFGEIYARPGLSNCEKTLTAVTTLAAIGGCETELATQINNSINVGVKPHLIIDTLIQMLPYVGFPRVVNAIKIAKQVFDDRGVTLD